MPYVVIENCIRCKYMDCVEVCPVDCFCAGENMLVIAPEECIDCAVCVPVCPANAIVIDTDPRATPEWQKLNADYAVVWPKMSAKGLSPSDADQWNGVEGKIGELSPAPHVC